MFTIPTENLRNLHQYKYSAVDHSFLGRLVMQRYWTFMLRFVPLWMHPNVVTLVGFAVLLLSIAPLAFHVVVYGEEGPWWGWVLLSLGTFAYQTLDALDGKQARRLGIGSPLGEMVDHGCDAVSATIVQFGISCCVCIPRSDGSHFLLSPYMQSTLCSSMVVMCFYLAMWDQQRTGQFVMGAINGPTEGLLVSASIFLLRGLVPSEVFSTPTAIPVLECTVAEAFFMFTLGSALVTASTNIASVVRKHSWTEAASILPMVALLLLVNISGLVAPSLFEPSPSLAPTPFKPFHHFVVCFSFGMICASAGTRLTIMRLTKLPFKHMQIVAFPLLTLVLIGLLCTAFLGDNALSERLAEFVLVVAAVSGVEYCTLCITTWAALSRFLNVPFATVARK